MNEDNFKNVVDRLNIDDKPASSHKAALRAQMLQTFNAASQKDSKAFFWRTIMKSPIEKSAHHGRTPFIVLGFILLVCKVIGVSSWFSSEILFRLIPLFFVLMFFVFFLKQNPLKIIENPYSKEK